MVYTFPRPLQLTMRLTPPQIWKEPPLPHLRKVRKAVCTQERGKLVGPGFTTQEPSRKKMVGLGSAQWFSREDAARLGVNTGVNIPGVVLQGVTVEAATVEAATTPIATGQPVPLVRQMTRAGSALEPPNSFAMRGQAMRDTQAAAGTSSLLRPLPNYRRRHLSRERRPSLNEHPFHHSRTEGQLAADLGTVRHAPLFSHLLQHGAA
jgi:hypothetical protein